MASSHAQPGTYRAVCRYKLLAGFSLPKMVLRTRETSLPGTVLCSPVLQNNE